MLGELRQSGALSPNGRFALPPEMAVYSMLRLTPSVQARLIKVRRKLDPADRLSSRMANVIDLVFGPIAMFLWDAFDTTH